MEPSGPLQACNGTALPFLTTLRLGKMYFPNELFAILHNEFINCRHKFVAVKLKVITPSMTNYFSHNSLNSITLKEPLKGIWSTSVFKLF